MFRTRSLGGPCNHPLWASRCFRSAECRSNLHGVRGREADFRIAEGEWLDRSRFPLSDCRGHLVCGGLPRLRSVSVVRAEFRCSSGGGRTATTKTRADLPSGSNASAHDRLRAGDSTCERAHGRLSDGPHSLHAGLRLPLLLCRSDRVLDELRAVTEIQRVGDPSSGGRRVDGDAVAMASPTLPRPAPPRSRAWTFDDDLTTSTRNSYGSPLRRPRRHDLLRPPRSRAVTLSQLPCCGTHLHAIRHSNR